LLLFKCEAAEHFKTKRSCGNGIDLGAKARPGASGVNTSNPELKMEYSFDGRCALNQLVNHVGCRVMHGFVLLRSCDFADLQTHR